MANGCNKAKGVKGSGKGMSETVRESHARKRIGAHMPKKPRNRK